MSLDAKGILDADDTSKVLEVPIPEWGGSVFVRVMSGLERDQWEIAASKDRNLRASLAFICLCDSTGKRLFTTSVERDALGKKSGAALDRVFDAARSLNFLSEKSKEDIEKN